MDFGWAAEPSVRVRARALSKCGAEKSLHSTFFYSLLLFTTTQKASAVSAPLFS